MSPTTARRSPSSSIPSGHGPTASRSPPPTSSGRSTCSAARAPCSRATRRTSRRSTRPTPYTVVIHTKQPDARIDRRPLHLHPAQAHLGQGADRRTSPAPTSRSSRWSAAAPTSSPTSSRGRILKMERNPHFRGDPAPTYDEIQFIKYGNQDAVERALQLGRDRPRPRGRGRRASTASATTPTSTPAAAPRPSYTELAFNLCSETGLPGRQVQPGRAGPDRAPGDRLRDRPRDSCKRSPPAAPRSSPTGSCRPSTSPSTSSRSRTTRTTPTRRTRCSTTRAGSRATTASARRTASGSSSTSTSARSRRSRSRTAKLIAEMAAGRSASSSTSRSSAPTSSPTSRARPWTASRRPTSTPSSGAGAATPTTRASCSASAPGRDRRLLRLLLLQPRVRPPVRASRRAISTPPSARRSSRRWSRSTQRDLPYLVLSEDPKLQAYRTDRIANVTPICPAETGDLFCDAGLLRAASLAAGADRRSARPSSGPAPHDRPRRARRPDRRLRRRRPRHAPARPRQRRAAGAPGVSGIDERPLARGQAPRGARHAALRPHLQLLPLPGHGRPDDAARPPALGATPEEIAQAAGTTTASTSRCSASSPTTWATR